MTGFQLIVWLILVIAPIGNFFHEMGHAIAARSLHANEIKLKIGTGKELCSISILKITIVIHTIFFIGGHTVSNRSPFYKKRELMYITLLGPLSNGVIAILLLIYNNFGSNLYIELAFWYNIWLFVINMMPLRIQGKCTDGYIVYKLLLCGQD